MVAEGVSGCFAILLIICPAFYRSVPTETVSI
jgi:hypothetical protein